MKSFSWYIAAAVIPLLLLIPILRLDRADLSIPFEYEALPNPDMAVRPSGSGDAYFVMMLFRSMTLTGSGQNSQLVGAPVGLDMRDHPMLDSLQLGFAKLVCSLTSQYGRALNIYYLVGFGITSIAMMFVLRRLGIGRPLALSFGVLYSLLPYHFLRGETHLLLGFYVAVPLAVLAAIWLATGELEQKGKGATSRSIVRQRRWLAAISVTAISCSGAYYASFSLFLFSAAGVIALWRSRSPSTLKVAFAVIGGAVAVVAVNAAPFLMYARAMGPNPAAVVRDPVQAEVYALKPIQLLLPITDHRSASLAGLSATYNYHAILVNENRMASLGILGVLGFLSLLLWLLGLRWNVGRSRTLTAAAQLNFLLLALGTLGGLGSMVAYYGSPLIRSYGRVSVFIAALSFLAVALVLQQRLRRHPLLLGAVAACLLVLGTLDQTSVKYVPLYQQNAAAFANDRDFVQRIEAVVPPGSMIFQLPYIEFPEGLSPAPYELFRPYLHSDALRWSFGSMKGREGDDLAKSIISLLPDPKAFLNSIRTVGYRGIYLDRALDDRQTFEKYLRANTRVDPIESANRRLLFFLIS